MVLGFLMLTVPLHAATPRLLTWSDSVRLVAQKNPEIAAALRDVESRRALYKGSYNSLMPSLSLSQSVSDGSGASRTNRWQEGGNARLDLVNLGSVADIRSRAAALQQTRANA